MGRPRKKKEEIQYTINMASPHESNALLMKQKAKGKVPQSSKMCIRCREIKPVSGFYKNRDNRDGKFSDIYCRECARELCKDKESVKKYFWENNRLWKDMIWEKAQEQAEVA